MIKNVILVSMFAFPLTGSESIKQEATEVIDNTVIDIIEPEVNLINGKLDNREELITAMAWVESGGNPATIGDINLPMPSVGLLQIRPIMVREVNRILRKQGLDKRFKNSDRKDGDKSIEMFNIWADAYHLNSSFEKMARNWNGGPKGYKKTATSHYWTKVTNYAKLNL
jgi:soluble lytic murein transglycosylase-like protein